MGARTSRTATPVGQKAVRKQLDRLLSSETFRQAARLKKFLTFVVNESIAGRGDHLKEYVIGVHVFDRGAEFDPRTDPIVRVQARRLRGRLAQYYEDEGQQDDLLIDLRKGRYAPVIELREQSEKPRPAAHVVAQNTIAVVGIADCSPRGDLNYICEGLRTELIHAISRTEGWRGVASPGRSERPGVDREDGGFVRPALEISGSVRLSGQRLRLTAHVIDSPTGTVLSSDSTDGSLDDVLTVQDAVATSVVRRLQTELAAHGRGPRLQRPIENLSARNLYLQGRYHLGQRTEEGLKLAVEFFEKALGEDPQYALAHSGLSDAFGLLGHYGVMGPADVWPKAASSAATAVMLDPLSVEAHTSMAHMKATQDWDWAASEQEFRLAIGLDPSSATTHHWYAMSYLVPQGRLDDALREMLIAQSLDPVSAIVARDVATIHLYRRDLDAALDQCDHTVELNPHFSEAYWTLGLVQEQRGDLDEALAAYQRGLQLTPDSPRMHAALGRAQALSGNRKAAGQVARRLRAFAAARYVSPVEFASLHLVIGQVDLALRSLTQAARDRCFDLLAIRHDQRFDPLRQDERLAAIIRQIGIE